MRYKYFFNRFLFVFYFMINQYNLNSHTRFRLKMFIHYTILLRMRKYSYIKDYSELLDFPLNQYVAIGMHICILQYIIMLQLK